MNEKYKSKDKILFYLYNIFFSSFFTFSIYFIFVTHFSFNLDYFINKNIPTEFDIHIITILFFYFVFWLIFLFLKLNFLPLLYKYTKNFYTKEILTNIANSDLKEKLIILLNIILFDIKVSIISIFINSVYRYFLSGNFVIQINSSINTQILSSIGSFGGVLPCYLSFLMWYKLTHKNEPTENQQ